jgi:hypothetical protein
VKYSTAANTLFQGQLVEAAMGQEPRGMSLDELVEQMRKAGVTIDQEKIEQFKKDFYKHFPEAKKYLRKPKRSTKP